MFSQLKLPLIAAICLLTADSAVLKADTDQVEYIDNDPNQFYPIDQAQEDQISFFLDWQNYIRGQTTSQLQFKKYYHDSMDIYQQLLPKFPIKAIAQDAYDIFQHALKVGSLPKSLKAVDENPPQDVIKQQVATNTSAQTSNFIGVDFATEFLLAWQHLLGYEQPKDFYYKAGSIKRTADNTMIYTWHKGAILDMIQLNRVLQGNAEDFVLQSLSDATDRWYVGPTDLPDEQITSSVYEITPENALTFAQWEILVFDYNYWIGLRYGREVGNAWLQAVYETVQEDQARFNVY